jgi:hypothetical protein
MSALKGAPFLDSVKLSRVHISDPVMHLQVPLMQWQMTGLRFDPYFADLPWDRLKELRFHNLELRCDDALYVLEMMKSLVRCSLDLETIPPALTSTTNPATTPADVSLPKPPQLVTLPALLALELSVSGWDSAPTDFFDRIILPSLKELSIKYNDPHSLPCTTLTGLQTRSSFSLERFALANRSGDSLLPFLQSNPLLSRLQLVFCALELLPLANALTRKSKGGTSVLPRLRTLTLADRWMEESPSATWTLATKAVIDMVRSRRYAQDVESDAQLEEFTFGSRAALSAKKSARFCRWRNEGMRVPHSARSSRAQAPHKI